MQTIKLNEKMLYYSARRLRSQAEAIKNLINYIATFRPGNLTELQNDESLEIDYLGAPHNAHLLWVRLKENPVALPETAKKRAVWGLLVCLQGILNSFEIVFHSWDITKPSEVQWYTGNKTYTIQCIIKEDNVPMNQLQDSSAITSDVKVIANLRCMLLKVIQR